MYLFIYIYYIYVKVVLFYLNFRTAKLKSFSSCYKNMQKIARNLIKYSV